MNLLGRRVLGVDLAFKDFTSNGSAVIDFDVGGAVKSVTAGAIAWPSGTVTAAALADTIDAYCRKNGISVVALDGPQGWRDPATDATLPGVGRRCEYACRTQAKTGAYPKTYPGNQRPWIELAVGVFDRLLAKPGVVLGNSLAPVATGTAYVLVECFPTSTWRASGLKSLPAKSKKPPLQAYRDQLAAVYSLPSFTATTHDDLQAVVAAVPAMALAGGPARAIPRGISASVVTSNGETRRVEGVIWDAAPLSMPDSPALAAAQAPSLSTSPKAPSVATSSSLPIVPLAYVTSKALAHANKSGRGSQIQIVLKGLPSTKRDAPRTVRLILDDEEYVIIMGDSHAAWRAHQTAATMESFDALFAILADAPDEPIAIEAVSEPALD